MVNNFVQLHGNSRTRLSGLKILYACGCIGSGHNGHVQRRQRVPSPSHAELRERQVLGGQSRQDRHPRQV